MTDQSAELASKVQAFIDELRRDAAAAGGTKTPAGRTRQYIARRLEELLKEARE